jgi:peptidoglycan hydrolase CwlO-like protein
MAGNIYNSKYNDDIEALLDRDLDSVSNDFSNFKEEIIKLDTHSNMINAADKFREKKLNYNENEITQLTKDMNTLRRQVEISQDSSKRKTDWIGILRLIFLYLSLVFLLIIFLRCGKILMISIFSLTVLFLIIIGQKLWNFTRRDKNRWDVIRWNVDKKKLPGGGNSDSGVDSCLMSAEENAIDTYEETKKKMLNNVISLETQIIQMGDSGKELKFKYEELAKQKANLERLIRENKEAIKNK